MHIDFVMCKKSKCTSKRQRLFTTNSKIHSTEKPKRDPFAMEKLFCFNSHQKHQKTRAVPTKTLKNQNENVSRNNFPKSRTVPKNPKGRLFGLEKILL